MKKRYQILLLCVVLFAVFSPSLKAEFCLNDDYAAYEMLKSLHGVSFKWIFFPGGHEGGYYRPLLTLSYLLDKYVWRLNASLMHFDNILFHIVNALLVYRLVFVLLPQQKRKASHFPLAAALLFGLHPITTESVNWISGRTDIMACTFVLGSALALIKFNADRSLGRLAPPFIMVMLGFLAKESAIGFLLGGAVILSSRDAAAVSSAAPLGQETTAGNGIIGLSLFTACAVTALTVTYSVWAVFALAALYVIYLDLRGVRESGARAVAAVYFRHLAAILLVMGGCIGLFFGIRSIAFSSNVKTISNTISLIFFDPNHACQVFLGAYGFYLKKFFLPLPLNFAIREIDPLYNLLGVVVFFFCIYLARRRTIVCSLFLAGIFMVAPALPLALGTVAWTAYAERYIYMSTAFWVVAGALFFEGRLGEPARRKAACAACVSLIVFFGVVTYQRSVIWQTNLALFKDTVEQSPRFREAREAYLLALYNKGDYKAAEEQYRIASKLPVVGYTENLDLSMAAVLVAEGRIDEATQMYEEVVRKSKGKSATAYDFLITHLTKVMNASSSAEQKGALRDKILDASEKMYLLNKDPSVLYQMGQLAMTAGDKGLAFGYFRRAAAAFPPGSQDKVNAERLTRKLQDEGI